jgi:regulator of protease activity HflC (stomatin/prohibitin superfamily)
VRQLKLIGAAVLFVVLLSIVLGSFYTIASGEIGVIQTFGKYQEAVSMPGLHWKRPFIDTVLREDVRLHTVNYSGDNRDDEDSDGILERPALDILDARNVGYGIELSVMFTPDPERMPFILATLGSNYFEKRLNPIVRDVARDVGGKYSVETIADHRDEINTQIRARLAESFKDLPFSFNDAALRKIDLPATIMEKIVAVQQAKQEEQRLMIVNNQAEQNKQITITNATAEQAKVVIAAEAEAKSIAVRAAAQAEANRKIAESLTPLLVQQNQVDKWNGTVPQVTGSGGGMILNLGKAPP